MNGAAQIVDAILAAFVSSSEETIFGNVFFEPIATAAAQGQKALAEGLNKHTNRMIRYNVMRDFLFNMTPKLITAKSSLYGKMCAENMEATIDEDPEE